MTTSNVKDMSDGSKALLWVTGALEVLMEYGIVAGESRTTVKGLALWDQLDKEYTPNDDELVNVVKNVLPVDNDAKDGLIILLTAFRDDREFFLEKLREKQIIK